MYPGYYYLQTQTGGPVATSVPRWLRGQYCGRPAASCRRRRRFRPREDGRTVPLDAYGHAEEDGGLAAKKWSPEELRRTFPRWC
jgi:hypothetical protein